jgi:hypothetical protein
MKFGTTRVRLRAMPSRSGSARLGSWESRSISSVRIRSRPRGAAQLVEGVGQLIAERRLAGEDPIDPAQRRIHRAEGIAGGAGGSSQSGQARHELLVDALQTSLGILHERARRIRPGLSPSFSPWMRAPRMSSPRHSGTHRRTTWTES